MWFGWFGEKAAGRVAFWIALIMLRRPSPGKLFGRVVECSNSCSMHLMSLTVVLVTIAAVTKLGRSGMAKYANDDLSPREECGWELGSHILMT